jgi:hypothetical protein
LGSPGDGQGVRRRPEDRYIVLGSLLRQEYGTSIVVDGRKLTRGRDESKHGLVATTGVAAPFGESTCRVQGIGTAAKHKDVTGVWIGLVYLRADKAALVLRVLNEFAANQPDILRTGNLSTLLNWLVAANEEINVAHTYGHWIDLDEQSGLPLATEHAMS